MGEEHTAAIRSIRRFSVSRRRRALRLATSRTSVERIRAMSQVSVATRLLTVLVKSEECVHCHV